MDKSIKIASLLGIFIISISIFYYLVVFLPYREQASFDLRERAQEAKEQQIRDVKIKEEEREESLAAELSAIREDYKQEWDSNVKRLGRTDETLPEDVAETVEEHYQQSKDEAFKRWGTK